MDEIQSRMQLAVQVAEEAGRATLEHFQRNNYEVERKSDDSPVTQADRRAEQLIRQRIADCFASDGIVGEEFGEQAGESDFQWILDPIDGTKSFISGVPLYSVLIGILHDNQSVAGVIHVPPLNESVYAHRGGGAWWRRGDAAAVRARVSERPLSAGVFLTSQIDSFSERGAAEVYQRLERTAYITRTWGDGYGYMLVATGRAEAIVDPIMNVWDAAPLLPILEEAGGAFSDWRGAPTIFHGEGIGSNREVHAEVVAVTREFPQVSR